MCPSRSVPAFTSEVVATSLKKVTMKRILYVILALLLTAQIAAAQNNKRPLSAQVQRGRELFVKPPKGVACGTCHQLAGVGTAVGPDLTKLASAVGPRGLVMAIQMSMTAYVEEVATTEGTFPGLAKQKTAEEYEIWDLSQNPPVLRKLTIKQVTSMKLNPQLWKHPPTTAEYTAQELADIVAFLKWAATGSQKEIKPEDVETGQ